jgi:hypothetical protein
MTMAQESFHNRACWTIENASIRVTVIQSGGHVAALVLKDGPELNPLWVQNRPTIDSDRYDPAIHGTTYGTGPEARLLSGLLGHNLCFPYWGDPSAAEHHAGMTYHGETNIVRWEPVRHSTDALVITTLLPESRLRFTRTFECRGQSVRCEGVAENLSAWDRPVAWCEHVTFGPPFLEPGITRFEASITRGFRTGEDSPADFLWPEGRGTIPCDLSVCGRAQHSPLVNSFLVDPAQEFGRFTARHPGHGLEVEYVFRREEYPWLNVWENHDDRLLTRGMEFSNTPVHGTMTKLMKTPAIWETPVYDWLDAKSKLVKRFTATIKRVPEICRRQV